MARYSNITIVAPEGTTQQSDDHLVCLPADWSTVLRFFLFNYVAHAFTVWSRPGETASEKVFSAVLAFFLPVSGLGRGIDAIYRGALLGRGLWTNLFGSATNATQVRTAVRAGALGILVRTQIWKGETRDTARNYCFALNDERWESSKLRGVLCQVRASIRSQVQVSLDNNSQTFSDAYQIEVDGDESAIRPPDLSSNRHVNGITSTPERFGYRIMELPRTSENLIVTPKDQEEEGGTEEANGEETAKLHIPQASNVAVALIAVLQIVYAGYGVLTVTGDQFDRFGYSAFHLTVLPYLVMSVVNLVGNLLTPTYPGITLVGTATSDEVHRRAGIVQSTIGYIENLSSFEETTNSADEMGNYTVIVYECSQNMTRYVQDSDYENTPMHYDNSIPHSLQICFDKECRRTHKGILKVPSGRPKPVKHPWAFCCKGPTLFLAVASHIVPIVYIGVKYPYPSTLIQKLVLPLWVLFGDIVGIYILLKGVQVSTLGQMRLWLCEKLFCGLSLTVEQRHSASKLSHKPWILMVLGLLGVALCGCNFYIVVTQILTLGRCIKISDSL